MELHRQYSDTKEVKHCTFKVFLFTSILFCTVFSQVSAYMVKYKEDYYHLYHVHYQQYPDDCIENIYWLERAVRADFRNPLYADAKIETTQQWEKYRYLYMMHLNLKLTEQHMRLGSVYDKKVAYFYDAPWKDEYLSNLEKAKSCYEAGLVYWQEAKLWAEKANATGYTFLFITAMQYQEDERERIKTGELDYAKTLTRELTRVQKVIDTFVAMESKNY